MGKIKKIGIFLVVVFVIGLVLSPSAEERAEKQKLKNASEIAILEKKLKSRIKLN